MGTKHVVPRAEGQGGIGTATLGWGELFITNTTNDSATQGGKLTLTSNDGAAMQSGSRLGVIEFKGAESSSALTIGARIEAICDAVWTTSENGASLKFYTTDANASESLVLTLDSNKLAVFSGAVAITGNLTVNGTTTTVNSTIVTIDDPVFTLGGDTAPVSETTQDKGIEFRYHTGSAAKIGFFGWDDSASAFTFIADATNNSEVFSGTAGNAIFTNITGTLQTAAQTNITSVGALNGGTITSGFGAINNGDSAITTTGVISGGSLDIEGNADIDGTLEADVITVDGTALNTVIAGVTVTNATNSAHISVADNESTNEENLITFIENASATGNVGLESDGDFKYNPSTGTVSATIFKGNIDAVNGDFDGTLEADAITVNGTALNTVIAGVTVANATNAGTLDSIDSSSFLRSDTGDTMSGVLTMTNRLHIIGQNPIWLASNNTAKINIDARSTGDGAQLHKWNRNYQDTAYLTYYEQWYDGSSYHSIGVSGDRWKLSDGLDVSGTLTATTIDTGQGATEVHLMNQNLRTSDSVSFANITGTTATFSGNIIGKSDNTTEVGTYSTGAIKRIRMTQGGEIHFGDTTTSNFLGLTEGAVNNFGDQDRLGLYCRNELKIYGNSNLLKVTIPTSGNITFAEGATFGGSALFNFDDNSSLSLNDGGTNASQIKAGAGDELYIGANNTYALRFLNNGTNNVVFDNSSNVGIGTSSPSSKLHLRDAGTNSDVGIKIGNDSRDWNLKVMGSVSDSLQFSTHDNSNVMTILPSGNVGIGTTSPSAHLEIKGSNTYNKIRSYFSGTYTSGFQFSDFNGGIWYDAAADDLFINGGHANSQLIFNAGGSEKMRITSGGDTTITTTTNQGGLTITSATDNTTLRLVNTNASASGQDWRFYSTGGSSGLGVGKLFIKVGTTETAARLMSFVDGGSDIKMGIGIASPTSTLHVVGTVNVTSTKNFYIDHPLESKKDTHSLIHASVESPEVNNLYRGKVDLINGNATVNLDTVSSMTEGTFVALNNNAQCFTTNESDWDAVKGGVDGNELTISCQNSLSTANVSWMVISNRKDISIMESSGTDSNGKLIVEEVKVQDP
tara:strand:+ start:1952 stop:5197 length:3246 start_codon:yes stop_codon:yes gene_type:complete